MSASSPIIYRPLIPVACALLAGIGVGAVAPGHGGAVGAVVLLCAAAVVHCVYRRRAALIRPLLFCAAVGYLLPQPWLAARPAAGHVLYGMDEQAWHITGTIRDRPLKRPHHLTFSLAARLLEREGRSVAVHGNIRVTVGGRLPELRLGDQVTLRAKLKPISNFNNPGGYDNVRRMALDDTRVRCYALGHQLSVVPAPSRRLSVAAVRDRVLHKMEACLSGHSVEARALLAALTLGVRDGLTPELREVFSRCGLAHLLAISGLHVGMVAAAVFAGSAWGLAWMPVLVRRGWTRQGAAACAFLAILVYSLLSGMAPATQRALVMGSALLLTWWIRRRHDWANVLALAAVVLLLLAPPMVLGPSFQLSFAAVAAILIGQGLYRPAADGEGVLRRVGGYLSALVWISILATLGTLPLVMYYFNQIALVGPLVNLAAVPLTGLVVLPAGLLGALSALWSDTPAALCWHVAAYALEALLVLARSVAAWPWAAVETVTPTLLEIMLAAGLVPLVLLRRQRRLFYGVAAVLALALCIDVGYWTRRRFDRRHLNVDVIDVGQGSANLLQLPGGSIVLVDGGGIGGNATFDVGRYVVAPFLWQRKIRTVDLVVLTHPDSDHLNGLLYILEHFNVAEVWSNHQTCATSAFQQWNDLIRKQKVVHPPFNELPREVERQGVRFTILNPPPDFLSLAQRERWRNTNRNSLVLQVQWGDNIFLFTGDIDRRAEADILKRVGAERLRSTVLIVPHHGSRTSSTQKFLDAVQPHEAIIPAGQDNRFGFPHAEVIQRIEKTAGRVWSTNRCGAVHIVSNGKDYTLKTFIPHNK